MSDLSDLYDNYDPNMSTDRPNMDPVPAAEYAVQVTEAKRIDKDNGDGMLKLTFQILEGEFEGRYLWENLNLRHSNPMAQEISQRSFTELWRDAMRLPHVPDMAADLEFKPIRARVGVEKRKDTGELQNRIKKYMPISGAATPAQHAAPTRTAPAASTGPAQDRRPAFLKRSA